MQHYKTVQVTAPAETGSAAADIVQAVMQAKLLQSLQTPRSGLCFAVSSQCYPYPRPRRPEMEIICIRYPTLLKQKYNRQASHDTCLCVYLIACTAAVQRGLAVQCRGCRPAQLHRGIHSPKQRRLRSMCPTLPEAVFCPRMSVSPCLLRRFIADS